MSCYIKDDPVALKEALSSINESNEKYKVQVVIVLDGPVELNIRNVVEYYGEQSPNDIVISELPINRGLGIALRHGASLCTGEYIFRLDSDDISIPTRVDSSVFFLDYNPDVSVVGGVIEEFNFTPKDCLRLRKVPNDFESIRKFAKFRNPMNHVSVCFRKNFFDTVTYEHMPLYEDYFLWINALNKGLVLRNLNDTFVYVRVADGIGDRRSGLSYFKKDINFVISSIKVGHLSYVQAFRYLLARVLVRFLPNNIITKLYKIFLRSNSE